MEVTVEFFRLLEAAEFTAGGIARLCGGHAAADIFLSEQLQVGPQLGIQFLFVASLGEESSNPI